MDNSILNNLLQDSSERQFWIKPWGHPERSPDEEEQVFDVPVITINFAKQPNGVQVGDILIVHRIKVSKLMFVAEITSSPHYATDAEIKKNPLLERWKWSVETRNLTPVYGSQWFEHSLKTFGLAKEYNKLNPQDQVKLGGIQFGSDKLKVSESFGEFVIKEIMQIKE